MQSYMNSTSSPVSPPSHPLPAWLRIYTKHGPSFMPSLSPFLHIYILWATVGLLSLPCSPFPHSPLLRGVSPAAFLWCCTPHPHISTHTTTIISGLLRLRCQHHHDHHQQQQHPQALERWHIRALSPPSPHEDPVKLL